MASESPAPPPQPEEVEPFGGQCPEPHIPAAVASVEGGSSEMADVEVANDEAQGGGPGGDDKEVLTDELRDQIIRQVEYYFSDENLPSDAFLLKLVKKNKHGFVPIDIIALFKRMKKLVKTKSLIAEALRSSSNLVVSSDGKKVRRLHPLPSSEKSDADAMFRTIVVENMLEDYTEANVVKIFGSFGTTRSVYVYNKRSAEEPMRGDTNMVSNKEHALVEYDSKEAAQKAVASLNDEKNWRSGMKVELLSKRMRVKRGSALKVEKEISQKGVDQSIASGEEINPTSLDDEKGKDHQPAVKEGRRNRYKGQRKGQPNDDPASAAAAKPIPGPRMPDGTRGFSMGRGQPLKE